MLLKGLQVHWVCDFIFVGKLPAKRQCVRCEDGAQPAKATADIRPKPSVRVLLLPKDGEESKAAVCQPSASSSAHVSQSSSSASSSEDETEDDVEPSAASHPANLLTIVKEKPTISDMVVRSVESIFRLLNK